MRFQSRGRRPSDTGRDHGERVEAARRAASARQGLQRRPAMDRQRGRDTRHPRRDQGDRGPTGRPRGTAEPRHPGSGVLGCRRLAVDRRRAQRGARQCARGVGSGIPRPGDRRREHGHRCRRDAPRPGRQVAGRNEQLVRPQRPTPDDADRRERPRHPDDGRHGRRQQRRLLHRGRTRRHLDRGEDLQRPRHGHLDRHPSRLPMAARPRRERGDRGRTRCRQRVLDGGRFWLQPGLPARPAEPSGGRDPARLLGGKLLPRDPRGPPGDRAGEHRGRTGCQRRGQRLRVRGPRRPGCLPVARRGTRLHPEHVPLLGEHPGGRRRLLQRVGRWPERLRR